MVPSSQSYNTVEAYLAGFDNAATPELKKSVTLAFLENFDPSMMDVFQHLEVTRRFAQVAPEFSATEKRQTYQSFMEKIQEDPSFLAEEAALNERIGMRMASDPVINGPYLPFADDLPDAWRIRFERATEIVAEERGIPKPVIKIDNDMPYSGLQNGNDITFNVTTIARGASFGASPDHFPIHEATHTAQMRFEVPAGELSAAQAQRAIMKMRSEQAYKLYIGRHEGNYFKTEPLERQAESAANQAIKVYRSNAGVTPVVYESDKKSPEFDAGREVATIMATADPYRSYYALYTQLTDAGDASNLANVGLKLREHAIAVQRTDDKGYAISAALYTESMKAAGLIGARTSNIYPLQAMRNIYPADGSRGMLEHDRAFHFLRDYHETAACANCASKFPEQLPTFFAVQAAALAKPTGITVVPVERASATAKAVPAKPPAKAGEEPEQMR